MDNGFFITLEGIDGAGKTTQMPLLVEYIRELGLELITVREPGGTAISEKIRELLLDVNNEEMSFRTEALLYAASRAQLVDQIIKPALEEGKVVIADRFLDSTIAYQGYGRGLDVPFLHDLNKLATGGLMPDLTLVLMVSPDLAWRRRHREQEDRMEKEGIAFQQRVLDGYLALARQHPQRVHMVDGEAEPQAVTRLIRERVRAGLQRKGYPV